LLFRFASMSVYLLSCAPDFPPADAANPDGLLAVGGDLSPERLLIAYQNGIFPWFGPHDPILWWSPDPRLVLYPDKLHVAKSLAKTLRQGRFRMTFDQAFAEVIRGCRDCRRDSGTWIVPAMVNAYGRLHQMGFAHSVEAWDDQGLAGGLYGVSLGRCFFGESMFSRRPNASKAALVHLVGFLKRLGFGLIDCQVSSDHLRGLGAREIPRDLFLVQLRQLLAQPGPAAPWSLDPGQMHGQPQCPPRRWPHGP